ncbi:MAG: 3,4-dihydroxy-2-butanone-4-phosphate synthase [Rothia sp. (in: high G+C Gram-positive bacteria)]|uniref:3,4-dihydroxy-2-butanone-4-phosphate synthase n=1 Tax=Rothia sp. (in: high G+C Gram-positive bacteria) TaxID=1885016 RepID=UPI0026E00AFE|nr:3,4-dihydroxy-2-butanone-4-phosphate synthase [Rothia sp. (in: high G+C Gram-positive bacteria)]MDO5750863.1 3,4-dihydroxy-2-butanone-4-phosphate synthase [Rothia sp. (in: high G+C Gram-positive bacteria)]
MFTGIIAAQGEVIASTPALNATGEDTGALYLDIAAGDIIADLEHGGSLAVNGVCLTALHGDVTNGNGDVLPAAAPGVFRAYAMGETLARTNVGQLQIGSRVNLERCMAANGRFDGHVVQGHVDATGTLIAAVQHDAWRTLRFEVPAELALLLVEKGSITVNGVSLTVTAVSAPAEPKHWFEVGLIPETLSATNLGALNLGDSVNLETDALAKYVQRLVAFDAPATSAHPTAQSTAKTGLDSIEEAIAAIAAGKPVVVVDDENRENEGDIIFAAEHATEELMGFTIRYTSGVICAPMIGERADALNLPPMIAANEDPKGTAYTLSCDAREGVHTGISAADRARTVQVLANPASVPGDLTRPGHVFPLRAVPGGVAQRPGHTEAAVDLCRAAGLSGVGVIAELNHDDGTMMRFDALRDFANEHQLVMVSIDDLIEYLAA